MVLPITKEKVVTKFPDIEIAETKFILTFLPGQSIRVVVGEVGNMLTYVEFSHKEFLDRFLHEKSGVCRRSKSPESKLSRMVGLSARAIKTGKWSTGAPIDRIAVFEKLNNSLRVLSNEGLNKLTPKAKLAISNLLQTVFRFEETHEEFRKHQASLRDIMVEARVLL